MTSSAHLSGPSTPFAGFARIMAGVLALAVGVTVFAIGATVAVFALLAFAVVALLALGVFWARARLTGRPFGPREHVEAMIAQMDVQTMPVFVQTADADPDAPVLDAHRTPSGWSVD